MFILDETHQWSVIGSNGDTLFDTATLRQAVQKAADYTLLRRVTGVARRPDYDIVISRAQFERLRRLIAQDQ